MRWLRLTVPAGDPGAEALTRALFADGAVAVEREGPSLVGHFVEAAAAAEALRLLREPGGSPEGCEAAKATCDEVPPPPWAAEWLAGHRPHFISPRLCVAPGFVEAPPATVTLRFDPGLAFGTAAHPTTFLCLEALDSLLQACATPGGSDGPEVLDVGCGTGILAIAAVRLGAVRAVGTDLDPFALRAARRQARNNGVPDERLLLVDAAPDARGTFPLVLANLPPPVLDALCGPLCRAVAPGGRLVLSGFFAEAEASVLAPFVERGLRRQGGRRREPWAQVLMSR